MNPKRFTGRYIGQSCNPSGGIIIGQAATGLHEGELVSVGSQGRFVPVNRAPKMPDAPVFWIRRKMQVDPWNPELVHGDGSWYLVVEVANNYVKIIHDEGAVRVFLRESESCSLFYGSLGRLWDWSVDRKTYHDFYEGVNDGVRIPNDKRWPTSKSHNPDKLTFGEVGVEDGWRLLDEDEIRTNSDDIDGIQGWIRCNRKDDSRWGSSIRWGGIDKSVTYRTKLSREELRKARGLT